MDRKTFLKALALAPLTIAGSRMNAIDVLADTRPRNADTPSSLMPVLFLGHGSPMNAIEENRYVQGFRETATRLPRPSAIVCVSAHWETRGTEVTAMEHPRTIHDFGGFPRELYEVQYPAPGDPPLALETQAAVQGTEVELDQSWGLDHGAWSVIKHLYPAADVPVLQLSLDVGKSPREHYALAKELAFLRSRGVLVIGSGNIVHNLGRVAWEHLDEEQYGFDWALEADARMREFIISGDPAPLLAFRSQGTAFDLAIPTTEHFLPLLYVLALRSPKDGLRIFNDAVVGGSISMTSLQLG